MKIFLDTSALAKRYVEEPGSDRVRELCSEAHALGLSVLVLPELTSTLCRLVRAGLLRDGAYQELKKTLLADLSDADLCDLNQAVLGQALGCLERNALRALDAIHLGSALIYLPDLFVSADRRQVEAARREGLKVEDLSTPG